MKTAKISLENIKDEGWYELGYELMFDKIKLENSQLNEDDLHQLINSKIREKFEYLEYGNIMIEVDENFNIIGGKVF